MTRGQDDFEFEVLELESQDDFKHEEKPQPSEDNVIEPEKLPEVTPEIKPQLRHAAMEDTTKSNFNEKDYDDFIINITSSTK